MAIDAAVKFFVIMPMNVYVPVFFKFIYERQRLQVLPVVE